MRIPSALLLLFVAAVVLAAGSIDAHEVSVCRDATYDIPAFRGAICSGAGAKPAGTACPKKGDVTLTDCHSHLPSFDGSKQGCVAQEDAVCEVVIGETWGCMFPTVGCIGEPVANTPVDLECATWSFDGDDLVKTAPKFVRGRRMLMGRLVGVNEHEDYWWFVQDTPVRELTACNRPNPKKPPVQCTPTPTKPQMQATPTPTPAPTPTPSPTPTSAPPSTPSQIPTPTPTPSPPCYNRRNPPPTPTPTPIPIPTPSSTPSPAPTPTPTPTLTPTPTPTPTPTLSLLCYGCNISAPAPAPTLACYGAYCGYRVSTAAQNDANAVNGVSPGLAIGGSVLIAAVIGAAFFAKRFASHRRANTSHALEIVATPV